MLVLALDLFPKGVRLVEGTAVLGLSLTVVASLVVVFSLVGTSVTEVGLGSSGSVVGLVSVPGTITEGCSCSSGRVYWAVLVSELNQAARSSAGAAGAGAGGGAGRPPSPPQPDATAVGWWC